jgi:hypothetical protein
MGIERFDLTCPDPAKLERSRNFKTFLGGLALFPAN